MVETILVPTDGSENSNAAVDMAILLGKALGASIHALTIAPEYASEMQRDQLRADPETDADHAIAQAEAAATDAGVPFSSSVREGLPDEQILQFVDGHDVDMVVMGTHGRTGVKRVLIGSVAEKIVRNAPVPVLTVPPASS